MDIRLDSLNIRSHLHVLLDIHRSYRTFEDKWLTRYGPFINVR